MNEERKVLVTHDGLNKFTVTYDNNRTERDALRTGPRNPESGK